MTRFSCTPGTHPPSKEGLRSKCAATSNSVATMPTAGIHPTSKGSPRLKRIMAATSSEVN